MNKKDLQRIYLPITLVDEISKWNKQQMVSVTIEQLLKQKLKELKDEQGNNRLP